MEEKKQEENEIINKKEKKKQFIKGILSVIGASLINFIYPSIFAVNTFIVYQTSYIKNHGGDVNIDHTIFYYPVELFFQSIFGLVAGIIYTRIEVHWSNTLGTVLLILGNVILYISKSLFLDMLSMAVYGIAVAVIMFPATTNACKYFMKHIGLVNGIVETFISLGSTVFAFLGEYVINPDEKRSRESDKLYDEEIAERFKTFVLIQIICHIGSYILSLFLIQKYKEIPFSSKEEEKLLTNDNNVNNSKNDEIIIKDYKTRKEKMIIVLKSWAFWRYNLISLSQSPISDMVFAMYRSIGESKRINQKALQLIGTLTFIIEFILSFVYGVLCDYVNFKILLFSMNIIGTIVGFTYCLTFESDFLFSLATLAISIQSAAYYSLKDYHLMKVFGTDIYVDLSGIVTFFTGIVVIILTFITYNVEKTFESEEDENRKDIAYWIMFVMFGAFNGMGVILGFFEEDEPFNYDNNNKEKNQNQDTTNNMEIFEKENEDKHNSI